jgi:DNA-binding LytR/AlgR family response regulator
MPLQTMTTRPPRALIADDERLMREQLRGRLKTAWPELEIVAEATNGEEAVALAAEHAPDIAFLDIRMPGLSGVEAAAQLDDAIHLVFVTAYDEYAVAAFDRGAVDYLLKPVAPDRLTTTVARLQARMASSGEAPRDGALLAELANHLRAAANPPSHLEWIQASVGERLEFIAVEEVLFFQSADKYTRVVRRTGEALIRKPIYELLKELDPTRFWQVHRSTIVNIRAIAEVTRDFRGHPLIRLRENDERLEVSRSFAHLFRQM